MTRGTVKLVPPRRTSGAVAGANASGLCAAVLVRWQHVGEFSLADLVHQFLDLVRSHRNANEHSELQCGTQEHNAESPRKGHDTLPAHACRCADPEVFAKVGLEKWGRRRCAGVENGEKSSRLLIASARLSADDSDGYGR